MPCIVGTQICRAGPDGPRLNGLGPILQWALMDWALMGWALMSPLGPCHALIGLAPMGPGALPRGWALMGRDLVGSSEHYWAGPSWAGP